MLGDNLQKLMNEYKFTEAALARSTGIPQPLINRILTKKTLNPRINSITPIAKLFRIPVEILVGNDFHKQKTRKIPLINSEHDQFIYTRTTQYRNAFAYMLDNDFMQPIFSKDSLLIFTSITAPVHEQYVLGYFLDTHQYVFGRLIIDIDKKYIEHLFPTQKFLPVDNIELMGSLITSIKNHPPYRHSVS